MSTFSINTRYLELQTARVVFENDKKLSIIDNSVKFIIYVYVYKSFDQQLNTFHHVCPVSLDKNTNGEIKTNGVEGISKGEA